MSVPRVHVQLRATFTNYRSMYIVFSLLALMMVVMTGVVPHTVPSAWQIKDAILMCPLAFLIGGHLLAPLVGALTNIEATGEQESPV